MPQETVHGYRLSPQQKRLWLLLQSDQRAPYQARCLVQIDGRLDKQVLQRALNQVVGEHEILRTTFQLLPGMTIPVQVIAEKCELPVQAHDFSELGAAEQSAAVDQIFNDAPGGQFDSARLPLLRADLVTLSPANHRLIINASGLCADGSSLQHLFQQLALVYESLSRGEEPPPTETMQYADFAEWQNELLESEEAASARAHWKEFDLRDAFTRRMSFENAVAHPSFRAAATLIEISPETTKRIRQIATDHETDPQTFLLACWQTLLWRSTGHEQITTGVLFDGRKFAELEKTVGLLCSYLPAQVQLEDDLSFTDLLSRLAAQLVEAGRWQEYFSWEAVALNIEEPQFFPFAFEMRRRPADLGEGRLTFSYCRQAAMIDRFKLNFVCEESADALVAELQYDASLFSADDARRLGGRLEVLITQASRNPQSALIDLELLSAGERREILRQFNDRPKDFPAEQCIHELFELQAAERPNDVAVVFENEELVFGELNRRANQLAHHLRKLGVGPDKTVGLCLERSTDLIVGLLGIMKAGGAYVPLDPGLPKQRSAAMLADAGARVLVTRAALSEGLSDQLEQVVSLDQDRNLLAAEPNVNLQTGVTAENLAYVIFTSGSTGRPKGVAVEQRQLVNYLKAIWERLDLPASRSFASVSTIAADLGNTVLFPPLCEGGTLHLISEERATNPDALAEYCRHNAIDCLKIVPSHLTALLSAANPTDILPRRKLVLGGEACPWSLIEKIKSLAPSAVILNHYGPTEATVGAVTWQIEKEAGHISETVPLGRPLANAQVCILDSRMRPVPIGAPGELHIGGKGVARGYVGRPDATAERFVPNPFGEAGSRLYKTGDLARYLSDGRIEFLGRVDDQVKIHGYRIEPREIELALRDHPAVAAGVVIAREDQPGDKRLVAYVTPRNRQHVESSELRRFLSGRLPEYMTPSAFVFLDRLPLTANGKIDKRALPAPEVFRDKHAGAFMAPRNQVEETLANIWANVLGIERVGVHDNFFELGGDSILSIQIIARANQAGLRLSPRQLFQHQTVAELAKVAGTSPIVEAEQDVITGSVPLTPVQARFFEQKQPEPHYYNQAMLLQVDRSLDEGLLKKAFAQLLIHHDALRLRFAQTAEGWRQQIAAPDGAVAFESIKILEIGDAERAVAIQQHAIGLQEALNLQDGPLLRAALFDCDSQPDRYLLIVIHHLAVDGVSWRVLLEDLQTLGNHLSRGEQTRLPAKTTSFKSWARRLIEYANSPALQEEIPYWRALSQMREARLPRDFEAGPNTAQSARTISFSLDQKETTALLQEVPTAYRTQINEALLTALARALTSWSGSLSLLLDLEGHGREEILEGVDLSRTVGWFTTIFPVVLDLKRTKTTAEAIRLTKEQLRTIPNRGIGYGLLRYATGDSAIAAELRAQPQAEVRFNYLGQLDRTVPAMFRPAPASTGPAQSLNQARHYLLNIIGSVSNGELRVDWTYSENRHRRETIERLGGLYLEALRTLIADARTSTAGSYVPSDFPRARLSQEDLDKVLARLGGQQKERNPAS